jgi:hypothetical protein
VNPATYPVGAAAPSGPGSVFTAHESELAAVGSLLCYGPKTHEQSLVAGLDGAAFADKGLGAVYDLAVARIEADQPYGMPTVQAVLRGKVDHLLIERAFDAACIPAHVGYHAAQILAAAEKRKLRDYLARATRELAAPGANPSMIGADLAAGLDQIGRAETGGLQIVDATAYVETDPPPHDPIIERLLEAGDKAGVIASAKRKKTFFTIQMGLAVASGRPFLSWTVPKPRRVLIIQMEIKAAHYHRRVHYMTRALGLKVADIGDRLGIVNARGQGLNVDSIKRLAREHRAELLILDPLYKLAEGDENKASDIKPLLAAFDEIAVQTGAAILWVHHDSKGSPGDRNARDRGAGSNVLIRDVDQLFTLTPHRDNPEATVIETLTRNYEDGGPVTVAWQDGCFVQSELAAVAQTSANVSRYADDLRKLDQSEPGLSLSEASERIGCDRSTISRLRKQRGVA